MVDPEKLTGIDTTEIVLPYGEGGAAVPEQKYRDVLKLVMTDGDMAYCILGIENQSSTHYAMPVRNMVYDAMQLAHQVTEAAQSHRRKKGGQNEEGEGYKASPEEYLSGFYKTDKLLPVVTLAVLWGPDEWDGPLSLREMYSAAAGPVMQYVPDYRVNLISPGQMTEEEIGEFKSSLKEVMLYIKYSKDKTRLKEVTKSDPGFRRLDRQAAEVINVTTNSKLKYPEGKETVDMCVAIQEIIEESKLEGKIEGRIEGRAEGRIEGKAEGRIEGKAEGRIEGAIETYKAFGFSEQETIQHIVDNYSLPLPEVTEKVMKCYR